MPENEVWRDRQKALFEFHKHVTSLNTAAILVFLAVLEEFKPVANAADKQRASYVVLAFGASLFVAFGAMYIWANRLSSPSEISYTRLTFWEQKIVLLIEWVGFGIGLFLLNQYVKG